MENCDTDGSVPITSDNSDRPFTGYGDESKGVDTPALDSRDVQAQLPFDGEDFHKIYQLGAIIGKGAYCTVHLATVKVDGPYKGMQVAVKCTERQNPPRLEEENLKEEVGILRNLDHPNIVEIYQFFQDDPNNYYVVMEFMEGGELFDRIVKKAYYNEKEARDLCRILFDAVKYIHDRGIVHRDLNLENLLLTSKHDDANIKLADFGFARSVLNGYVSEQCGTPSYVAPEVLRGETYGTSVDMWSIGVIIYILLSGYPPFHDRNQFRQFRKIQAGCYEFHEEYWCSVSSDAKDLITKLLTVDPEKRLTAEQAVSHPWLFGDKDFLSSHNLSGNLEQLKLFNARRKLRAAITSVVAAQTLAANIGGVGTLN